MNSFPCLAFLALSLAAGSSINATAASFQIQGIAPVAAVRGVSPPAMTANFTVTAPGTTQDWTASLEGSPAWASLSAAGGSGAGSLTVTFNTASLTAGSYNSALILNSGGTLSRQAFALTVITPNVITMEADYNRPVIYALHRGTEATNPPGYLIFYNTGTEQVEKVIPAGTNPTDMDVSYADDKLYLSNHLAPAGSIRVIDLVTRREIRSMNGGTDVYKINAGKSGRIVSEGLDQWINADIRNSATGASLTSAWIREGDGECDPSGRYYYHCDNNISNAHITRYDIQADAFTAGPTSIEHAYGTRNLVMAGDGSRIFWNSYAYDPQLNELRTFGTEIYASTFRGEIVFSNNRAYNGITGAQLATLPVTTTVMAVSGDQQKLILFNAATGTFSKVLMSAIGPVPPPVSAPVPADNAVILAPLNRLQWSSAAGALRYRVYFGTNAAAVAAANAASPLYLGETTEREHPLTAALVPGTAYYWRVDPVGFSGTDTGTVWKFTVSGLTVAPNALTIKMPRGGAPRSVILNTSAAAPGTWTAAESLSWLTLSTTAGNTGDPVTATLTPGALASGSYQGTIQFTHNGTAAALPVSLELFDLELTRMIPDPARPWVYGLHSGTTQKPGSFVVCINTGTKQIENVIATGIGATDLAINHQEGRLYVSNWQATSIQVVNLETQTLLAPIPSERDVYKLNAGRAGRIYAEGQDQWVSAWIINSATGATVGTNNSLFIREGDGEVDPTGRYYYHCDNNSSGAVLTKYDVSEDKWTLLKSSVVGSGYGTRNLVMSPDGNRLFWQSQMYDTEMNVLRNLGAEVYATTQRGELAVTSQKVLNTANGAQLASLPVTTTVMAVAGDQSAIFYFHPTTKAVGSILMSSIAPVPPVGTNGQPPNNSVQLTPVTKLSWDVVPSALKYRIYFGTDATAVASATTASPQYAGETLETGWTAAVGAFPPGGDYYWRVDTVGLNGTTAGAVWKFTTSALVVNPKSLAVKIPRGTPARSIQVSTSAAAAGPWTATESLTWLTLSAGSGNSGDPLNATFNATGLAAGTYTGNINITFGGNAAALPVSLEVFDLGLTKMVPDPSRPWVYALHPGTTASPSSYIIFINTATRQIENVIAAGTGATDLAVHAQEGRLYVTNWQSTSIQVIDLETRTLLPPIPSGRDVYKLSAGRSGRIYSEGMDQWVPGAIINSATGAEITTGISFREGDGELDPTGRYYYHCDNNISNAHITRYDVKADTYVVMTTSTERPYGSRNLVMSGDGSRLYWQGYAYDAALNELRSFGSQIYAATYRGEVVFSDSKAFNGASGAQLSSLPVTSTVMAVAGDQSALFYFNPGTKAIGNVLMSSIAPVPPAGTNGQPPNNSVQLTPLTRLSWDASAAAIKYRVYFGTDAAAVGSATPASPQYAGETSETGWTAAAGAFPPGGVYYWRVDTVGLNSTTPGTVWKFTTSALVLNPMSLAVKIPRGTPARSVQVSTSATAAGPWTATESLTWLTLSAGSGNSGDPLNATFNATGLAAGTYTGNISITFGGATAALPVSLEVFDLVLTKMVADSSRPWVYGLHPGTTASPSSYIVFVNTATKLIQNVVEAGTGATDLAVHAQEGRLYVSNWQRNSIQVIDLETQTLRTPIPSGRDVYKLSAGRSGRIYSEGMDQWVTGTIINSATGAEIANAGSFREGDGELDPSGRYYYHCDNNISNAHITRYDVQADTFVETATSTEHPYGSRNLVMSGDGSRLFWQGYGYDGALNELRSFGSQIYAATYRGEVVFSDSKAFNGASGSQLGSLPVTTTVSVVAGDQSGLFYYNPTSKIVGFMAMSTVAPVPVPGTNSQPPHNSVQLTPLARLSWDTVAAALKYRVFFGTDAAAVAAATAASSEYAGETVETFWPLTAASVPAGGTFYWRVDYVGLTSTTAGSVKSFQTLPVTVAPAAVDSRSIWGAPVQKVRLIVSGIAGTAWTATTSGAGWLRVVTPSGTTGDTLELELAPGSLTAGNYTGTVTLTAGAKSAAIPVKFGIEAPSYIALKSDPARPRLYALQRPASLTGSLVMINTATSAVERVIPLSDNPSDFDLTADNQYLYVITRGGRKMHRIHLEDWSTAEKALPATPDHSDSAVRYRIAAGAGTKVYWVDGQWAPMLHSMDFATGQETGEPIVPEGTGFGAIARTRDGASLAAWAQYGWSAGSSSSKAQLVDTSGASAAPGAGGVSLTRDPLDTPVITRSSSSSVFMKKYRLSADLSTVEVEYPAEVYAATATPGIVFGAQEAWRERTLTRVWQAPSGVNASICAVAGDQSAFFYFNTATSTLVRVAMSSLGDIPGPGPENGEIVSAMPESLTWTPNPQALRYEVYFGTDQAGVLAASGTDSPLHLGTANQASLPFNVPFQTAGVWWWRVDTVLPGSTVKGSVWKFSGALSFLSLLPGMYENNNSGQPLPLAMDGTVIMSGHPYYYTSYAEYEGQVLVRQKRPGTEEWFLSQKISKPATASKTAQFGSAIAMKGNIAWIGAANDGTGGRAYEYRLDSTTRQWAPTGRSLQSATPAAGDYFGSNIAFDGKVIAVAAWGAASGAAYQAGAVEIFDASTLARHVRITEAAPANYVGFGRSMALGDGFLAIANPSRTVGSTSYAGAVDIWTRGTGTTWSRTATINPASPASVRSFGTSLAISGPSLFIGTPSDTAAGKVFVYQKGSSTAWNLISQIDRAGPARTDQFTSTLAASGDRLAVGTPPLSGGSGTFVPSVWLHRKLSGNTWTPVAPAVPGNNKSLYPFGASVALSERYLAVLHTSDSNSTSGVTVYLHDPAGNLPPYVTSSARLFAEVDKPYRYAVTASDENTGDKLTFSAAAPLPAWLSLTDNADGTALLYGTPPAGSAGDVAISLNVRDSAGGDSAQSFVLKVLPSGGIPEFSSISGDQTSNDGKRVELSASVVAGAPVTYQWYQDGVPLSGQNGATLVIEHAQASDAGSYYVRVTRSGVWADSDPMNLTVTQVPDRFGGDWPTFGAGNSHSGSYPATLSRHKFFPAWTVPDAAVQQVATGNGRVYAVNGGRFTEGPVMAAYNLTTGTNLWSTAIPVSSSINPPTYHRGKVYMQRGKNTNDSPDLRCFDAATGALQWKADFGAQWESYFAPAVDDTGVYINGGGYGGIYRFGLDGTQVFFLGLAQYDDWTPLLHQGRLYSWVAGSFSNHDPGSGQINYSVTVPWSWSGWSMNTVAAAEGNTAVMLSTTDLISVDLTTRRVLWKKTKSYTGSPAIHNGIVYAIREGGVESFDAVTGTAGKVYPTLTTSGQNAWGLHQPVLLDDTLIVSSMEEIWTFNLATGALLQRLGGGGPLTYTDGYLLAAGSDSTLRAWKVNQPAMIAPPAPELAATEDIPFQWDIAVTDPDGDTLTASVSGLPPWLTASPLQQGIIRLSGTPLNQHAGRFTLTITANDAQSFVSTTAINGSVLAVNDRPTASTPAPVTVDEDSAIPPLPLSTVFSDEEDEFSALSLTILENSNPALFSQAAISSGQLQLTLTQDAHGSAVLKITATDSGGLTVEATLTVTVLPVADAPRITADPAAPVIPPDGTAFTYAAGPLFSDPDPGEVTTWTIASVDRPELFRSLTIEPGTGLLSADWTPYVWGTATVIIRATGLDGLFAETPVVLSLAAPPAPEWTLNGTAVLNRQTGLVEQRVTVKNTGIRAIAGFSLSILGSGDTVLYNGMPSLTGSPSRTAGSGILPYALPLGAGAEVTLVMEFYSPSRLTGFSVTGSSPLDPLAPALPLPPASGAAFDITRALPVAGGMLIEFPSEPGEHYRVEYSADNSTWTACPLPIQGGGTCVQWIDRGPPFTLKSPQEVPQRFYRIRKL